MITDFLSFEGNPEFVAAFRFMFWSVFLGLSMIAWRYYRLYGRDTSLSCVIIFASIGAHQFYYWSRYRANAHGDEDLFADLESFRHATSALLIIMCIAAALYARKYLNDIFNGYWKGIAAAAIIVLWLVGYGDARWL